MRYRTIANVSEAQRRILSSIGLLTALVSTAACGVDLGEVPFECNVKGSPLCPDGYECKFNKYCVKNGSCPSSLIECQTTTTCGNGVCDSGETPTTCPADCKSTSKCGNGVCDSGETPTTCPADCKSTSKCGNGVCDSGETPTTCPADCKTSGCGNGTCDSGETPTTCPADCAVCSGTSTLCDGKDKLKYCENSVWKTDTCQNLCTKGGYDYATECALNKQTSKYACLCGKYATYGGVCDDAKLCATNLVCASYASSTFGFCTKYCTASSGCTGGPSGSKATCSLSLSGKQACGFECEYTSCPSGMDCDWSDYPAICVPQ